MGWHVERAVLPTGRVTWLVVEDELYAPHREVREYVAALEAADRSPNTIKTYLPAIAMFLTWCEDSGVDWRVINLLQLARFKRALEDAPGRSGLPRAASSVSIQLTAMCEFLRYCAAAGHVDPEVAHRLVETRWVHPAAYRSDGEQGQFRRVRTSALRVDRPELPPEVLSDDQVAAMRDAASCARDRFLLRVLHDGGPRIGECLGLQIEDVHLLPDSKALGCAAAGPHFHVVRRVSNENDALGKSRRRRTLPVIDEFIEDYRDYRYERSDRLPDVHSRFVFVNYEGPARGAPMTYSNAFKIISRLGKKVGVRATPHMFRHSAATAWVESGTQIDVVQELLGHASPKSTAIYMHASPKRMREAVTNVHRARTRRP